MRIYLQSTTGRWIVCYFNDQHNHQLLPGFGRIHRSQSKITEPDMEEVRSLRTVGIKMPHIYASFAERVGGYPYVGFKKKALYNRLHGENKDGVGHAVLKYMRKSVSTDLGFVWKHATKFTVAQLLLGDLWLPSTGVDFTSGLDVKNSRNDSLLLFFSLMNY
ncbi:hypothetical protein RIF29_10109 [Crotalaria pallida]|uniref:FAR1 domain-containing protein n=1 Tax=Crotalaria pallida TaxID=3830 RepID=A0AAN9II83_CROPI